jgi:hypothetical protein
VQYYEKKVLVWIQPNGATKPVRQRRKQKSLHPAEKIASNLKSVVSQSKTQIESLEKASAAYLMTDELDVLLDHATKNSSPLRMFLCSMRALVTSLGAKQVLKVFITNLRVLKDAVSFLISYPPKYNPTLAIGP